MRIHQQNDSGRELRRKGLFEDLPSLRYRWHTWKPAAAENAKNGNGFRVKKVGGCGPTFYFQSLHTRF
jgi:hypothetical protein